MSNLNRLKIGENDSLTFENNVITATIAEQTHTFPLEAVQKLVILTTDLGPFYDDMGLAVDVGGNTVIFIMSEHRCYKSFLFEQIGNALPLDYQKIIDASMCTERNIFEIYTKQTN